MASKKKNKKISLAKKKQSGQVNVGKTESRKKNYHQPVLPGRWTINAGIFILFVIATMLLYRGDFHLGFFNLDDPKYILENPWIRGISTDNISHILTEPYFANYSPMHLFSYMIDHAIGENNPYIYHLSSNIWAGIVAGFVYLVALAITKKRTVAIAASVLFIVHPIHVEAVAWISSRKDLVAAAFVLPSFLAYLYYRINKSSGKRWYFLSLLLFIFALAGKLSVAAFPAVLFLYDLFIEKRPFFRSLADKVPFLLAGILFTVLVAEAQPTTGMTINPGVLSKAFLQGLWLLTGFGNYVIYRDPPISGNTLFDILGVLGFIVVVLLPLLFRNRFSAAVVLFYWIFFAFFPTQVLSFINPVTDRYLFLPSVAACILLAWGIISAGKWLSKWKIALPAIAVLVIAIFWTKNTLNYLGEWKDPRTVWYAAKEKSSDMQVYYNLALAFKDKASQFGNWRRTSSMPTEETKKFAAVVWKENSQLPLLLNELTTGQQTGSVVDSFKLYVQEMALNYFNLALEKKGNLNIPDLYYYKGELLLDMGDPNGAKYELSKGVDEALRISYLSWQQEMLVKFHCKLADAEYGLGNYSEALRWVKMAEEEQIRFGGNWVPSLPQNRQELELIIDSLQYYR